MLLFIMKANHRRMDAIDTSEIQDTLANTNACKIICAALQKLYPTRQFYVLVQDFGLVATIAIPGISLNYGRRVKLTGTERENIRRCVTAAGEILERFQLDRARRADNDDVRALPRNAAGVVAAKKGEL